MEVIALKRGYHGKLREPGEKFSVPNGEKASWFSPVEQKPAGKGNKPPAQGDGKPADDLV